MSAGEIEMIDINELRRLAQAATPGPWVSQGRYIGTPRHMSYVGEVRDQCGNWSDTEKSRADAAFISAANPAAISELLDRLEAAGEDRSNFLVEMGKLCAQCDALRAKIAEMERQEPLDADSDVFRSAFEAALKAGNWPATRQGDGYRSPSTQIAWRIAFSTVNRLKLYLAPGAQPEPSVPDGWKLVPIEPTEKMINEGTCASTLPGPRYIDSACAKQCWTNMLAAASEAKP